jgi:hypothetical protein
MDVRIMEVNLIGIIFRDENLLSEILSKISEFKKTKNADNLKK